MYLHMDYRLLEIVTAAYTEGSWRGASIEKLYKGYLKIVGKHRH